MQKKRKTLLIIGAIALLLMVSAGLLIYKKTQVLKIIKPEPDQPNNPPQPPPNEEEKKCPYLNEQELTAKISEYYLKKAEIKDKLAKLKKIPHSFVAKLWKKGYHWIDITQLWSWKIPEKDIPDLKTKKRIGVINELGIKVDIERSGSKEYREEMERKGGSGYWEMPYLGVSRELVVIMRKTTGSSKINIDENIQESPLDFDNYDKNTTRDYIENLVNLAFSKENRINSQHYEISIIVCLGTENLGKETDLGWGKTSGSSAGSAIYLAFLSSLHQKPISNKITATGTIKINEEKVKNLNGQEVVLRKGDNIPIGSLKEKAAVAAEKGFNQLILSKYHSSPNILTKPDKKDPTKNKISEDYQQVVPAEIRAKLTVRWTENMKNL
jgi:hypothetical protein